MPVVDLICLANSHKRGGRCVAGLRTDTGRWLRVVSSLPDGPLLPSHYRLGDGTDARPLDLIRVETVSPKPDVHHPENWLMAERPWQLLGRPLSRDLYPMLQKALSADSELLQGHGDQIPFEDFLRTPATHSLTLIAPQALFLYSLTEAGKTKVRGRFQLGARQTWYDLAVTDPLWRETILKDGEQDLFQMEQPFVLCISLSEPYHRQCYKLIATIAALPGDYRL